MGLVYAEVELINGFDFLKAEAGELPEAEVRRMPVRILVDGGCGTLAINENIRNQLGLRGRERRTMQMADASVIRWTSSVRSKSGSPIGGPAWMPSSCPAMRSRCWERFPCKIWMCSSILSVIG